MIEESQLSELASLEKLPLAEQNDFGMDASSDDPSSGTPPGSSMSRSYVPRFRNLPLFWKLLVPFLALIIAVGALGTFLIVRDLSSRANTALDAELQRRALEVRSSLRDRELYLVESANFASNVQGMASAIQSSDPAAVSRLLGSVVALKPELDVVAATNAQGRSLAEFARATPTGGHGARTGTDWFAQELVRKTLRTGGSEKSSGFVKLGDRWLMVVVAPICADTANCRPVGVSISAIGLDVVTQALASAPATKGGVALYNTTGILLASAGTTGPASALPGLGDSRVAVRTSGSGDNRLATLAAPLDVGGRSVGMIAVSLPTRPAFSSVRGAGVGLALVILAAMSGIVGIGAVLSRYILRQVKPLVKTSRALGRGDLFARAEVVGEDELGELARGVNDMADQLQASVETLEVRVSQRTEEIRRLLGERNEFFAAASHQLRTPIGVIMRQADLMDDPAFRRSKMFAQTSTWIRTSAQQLELLVNNVLELARAEAGAMDLDLAPISIRDVIEEIRPTIAGLAAGGGLTATIRAPADLPLINADRSRLREVLINLADNAVKYTPAGGMVTVSAQACNGGVSVSVADTGVGIPREAAGRIFEPFYRVKGNRPQRGEASSGLGLALVKRMVEAHGGEVEFQSEPGVGTTFTFTIPAN